MSAVTFEFWLLHDGEETLLQSGRSSVFCMTADDDYPSGSKIQARTIIEGATVGQPPSIVLRIP